MSDQTKGCLGVAACVASLDVLQAIVRTSPVSAVAVVALVVGAAIVYGALALLVAALLDAVGLRFTSGRNAGVWYGASALVLAAGLGFALQSARSDATTIASVSAAAPAETAARPNILLITMDTTRRDHLGPYGYHDARTPHLDALARQSVVFEDAASSAPLTGPSHTTMLTGLYPVDHGVEDNGVLLPPDTPTIADTLRAAGYRTAAFVSGWTLKDRALGLAPHFDYYDDEFNCWRLVPDVLDSLAAQHFGLLAVERLTGYRFLHRERLGETTTKRALAWLSRPSDRPFFALVHYFDAHGPHMTPLPDDIHRVRAPAFDYFAKPGIQLAILGDPARLGEAIRGYDDEIAYVDAQVGSLLEQLDAIGAAKNTVVIVTADHGEGLTEHGEYFGHGEFLYETTIRVPLMIRFPDGRAAGTRPSEQVGLVDLAPTMAEIASTGTEGDYDGTSLLRILDGKDEDARTRFGSVRVGSGDQRRTLYYARAGGYKLIWNFDHRKELWGPPAYEEIYDLRSDPNEEHDLIAQPPPLLDELRRQLRSQVDKKPPHVRRPSEVVREQLRALGYE